MLRKERGISFEEVTAALNCALLDVVSHPNQQQYGHQRMFIVEIRDYAYVVPFVEDQEQIFLKTIFPSRKATQEYLIEPKQVDL